MPHPRQAVFGCGDEHTLKIAGEASASRDAGMVHIVSPEALTGQADWPSLQGPHNLQNAAIAVEIVRQLGIGEDVWRPALASFVGLPHRMERVAEAGGVLYVNDSKATNPASTAPALGAYPRIHWILGGLPKSDDLDECAPYFSHVVAAYTIGEAGPRFAELLEGQDAVTHGLVVGIEVNGLKDFNTGTQNSVLPFVIAALTSAAV